MSTVTEITRLRPSTDGSPEDLFICCASYEERSVGAVEIMEPEYQVSQSFVFVSKEYRLRGNTEIHLDRVGSALTKRSNHQPQVVEFAIDRPMQAVWDLDRMLTALSVDSRPTTCTIDISSFPRQELLVLLQFIQRRFPTTILRLVYCSPERYATEEEGGWLTRGVQALVSVPGFGGVQLPGRKKLLVLVLGHEGERAHITWRRHQPECAIAIRQGTPYKPGLDAISNELNSLLCATAKGLSVEPRQVAADSVDEVCGILADIYERYRGDYFMVVSPLGTKLQTLGVYRLAASRPDVQITYAVPVWYNWENYSTGVGRIWQVTDLSSDPVATDHAEQPTGG